MYTVGVNDDELVGIRDFRDVAWLSDWVTKLDYESEFIEWLSHPELARPFLGMWGSSWCQKSNIVKAHLD